MNIFEKWVSPYNSKEMSFDCEKQVYFDGSFYYAVIDAVPDFTYPQQLSHQDSTVRTFYSNRSDMYDKYLHLTFHTYNEDENKVRESMVDLLEIKESFKVLEIGCGTGRDSVIIAQRLKGQSELHLQDLSSEMLMKAREKLINFNAPIYYSVGNASYLPYPDNYFDAVFQFGGVGEFSDIKRFFKEVVRVAKLGAKVVVGDENLPIWQRNTLFGKILSNYNPQFLEDVPFKDLPIEASEVRVQWIIGGVFYLIDFRVHEGEPYANFDFEISGPRGGTHRTRYFGQLEGVTEETKKLALEAQPKTGKSMHKWLDEIVKIEALKLLQRHDNK